MVQIAVLEHEKQQELENTKHTPAFLFADVGFFSKLLTPSSLMAFTNLHSTAFSVFTDCSFSVIIWIAPLFGILLDGAIHMIPDSSAVLLLTH